MATTLAMVAAARTGGDTEGGSPVPDAQATPRGFDDTLTVYFP